MTRRNLITVAMLILACLILGTSIGIVAQPQPKIGPWVGLRIPIFDNLKKGQSQPYWFFKLDPDQFEVTPDPAGTSDGILHIKGYFPAGVGSGTGTVAGEVQLKALAPPTGPADYVSWAAPDTLPGTVKYVMPQTPPKPNQPFDGGRANEQMMSCSVPALVGSIMTSTCTWR